MKQNRGLFKALIILTGGAYLFLIGSILINEWPDMKRGLNEGFYSEEHDKGSSNFAGRYYYLHVEPKGGVTVFPDSLVNIRNGNTLRTQTFDIIAISKQSSNTKTNNAILGVINTILSLLICGLFIYIPIVFFKLLRSIKREVIFEIENIRRIRIIGISLLAIYFFMLIFYFVGYQINNSIFDFVEYKIVCKLPDVIWLVLGFVTLLIAEIVARGNEIKIEQDLTV